MSGAAFGESGAGCFSCRYWSEDDDGDGRGCCAVLLNEQSAMGWRTLPGHICVDWFPAKTKPEVPKTKTEGAA